MKRKNDFRTSIDHPVDGIPPNQVFEHYTREWERLNRLAKLAEAANEEDSTIKELYLLMDDVAMILEDYIP